MVEAKWGAFACVLDGLRGEGFVMTVKKAEQTIIIINIAFIYIYFNM